MQKLIKESKSKTFPQVVTPLAKLERALIQVVSSILEAKYAVLEAGDGVQMARLETAEVAIKSVIRDMWNKGDFE